MTAVISVKKVQFLCVQVNELWSGAEWCHSIVLHKLGKQTWLAIRLAKFVLMVDMIRLFAFHLACFFVCVECTFTFSFYYMLFLRDFDQQIRVSSRNLYILWLSWMHSRV